MTSERRFNRAHAVCARLRDKPCKLCPAFGVDPNYGKMRQMCYALAVETINIAVDGNPWGKRGVTKHVKRWRRNFNDE